MQSRAYHVELTITERWATMPGAPRPPKKAATPKAAARPNGAVWNAPYPDDDPYGERDQGAYPRGEYDARDDRSLAPRLTLPSMPLVARGKPATPRREDSGRHRTLLDATSRQQAMRAPSSPDRRDDDAPTPSQSGTRRRENSTARPLSHAFAPRDDDAEGSSARDARERDEYDDRDEYDQYDDRDERALVPVAPYQHDLVPNLAAFRPRAAARIRADTRALAHRAAGSPWSITRLILAIAAITAAILTALISSGEAAEPLMGAFGTTSGSQSGKSIASMVQAETQIERPDLYDSTAQFYAWKGAACSAAALSEDLTAWGQKGATIGKMIDTMNNGSTPNISPYAGLLRTEGFQFAANQFGYRADIYRPSDNNSLSYDQIMHITHDLGIPLIINVRISYGYYSFFAGGHFLVITDADPQGVEIVDSSTYYIHYLQKDVLYQMFTNISVVVQLKSFPPIYG
jgi:hypothetical protein